LIAKAIKKYEIPREKLVILSKCYFVVKDDPRGGRLMGPQVNSMRDYVNKKGSVMAAITSNSLRLEQKAHLRGSRSKSQTS
jgi:aryl-alcohol dehydrogenase-like predicted oxidoreductase